MFKHILVSLDGSDCSKKALLVSIGLAQAMESQISLVSVAEPLSKMPTTMNEVEEEKEAQEGYFHKIQQEAKEKVKSSGLTLNNATILRGHVAKAILNQAKAIQCDLIVMGHSGLSGVWANFLGTTAEKVSRNAHCTVMIVR